MAETVITNYRCSNCSLSYNGALLNCPNCGQPTRVAGAVNQCAPEPERNVSNEGAAAIMRELCNVDNERVERRKAIDVACETIALSKQRLKELDEKKAKLERDLEHCGQARPPRVPPKPHVSGYKPEGFA